ncbi:heat shock protein HslJ [Marmoricola sp. OAE513]|uniref:META domain-containing protein n=1 Tax=Marmoricola sp. OAE513 TaxID=2817894 RepID=UPI001AEB3C59
MTPRHLLGTCVLVGLLLTGCGSTGVEQRPAARNGVDGPGLTAEYVVTGATSGGKPRPLVRGSEIRISIADGRISISAGCNAMNGAYTLTGTRLEVVGGLATTDMGCEKPLMDQDAWVAGLFTRPVQLSTGKDAAIISGDVVLGLADRADLHPDEPLAGTVWVLDSVGESKPDSPVSSVPEGLVAYLRLEDGEALTYDGCNGGGAPYERKGDRLVFGDLTTDLRGCTGPQADDLARLHEAYAEVFAGTASYSIKEKRLTLTHGDVVLGFRAEDEVPVHD